MSKILAETTGKFQLVIMGENELLPAHRPGVVQHGSFISSRAAVNQVRVLAEVQDEATDAEFAAYWAQSAGDRELAIESFLSRFAIGATGAAEVETKNVAAKRTSRKAT